MLTDIPKIAKCANKLTHISLAPFCGTQANSTDLDQTLQNVASDQGIHCLLAEYNI